MKIKSKIAIILSAVLLCLLSAILCLVFLPKQPDSITLAADDVTMICGEIKEISYVCSDENAVVSFESYNSNIVEISEGKLVAKKAGKTSIRVKAQSENNIAYSSFKVTVSENTSLPLTNLPEQVTLYLLDKNFEAARADGYDNQISFVKNREISSTDSVKCVKVSANKITASKVGSGEVVFRAANGESQTVKVNVLAIEARLTNLPTTVSLKPTESFEIEYEITPSYYTGNANVAICTTSDCLEISDNIVSAKTSGEGSVSISLGEQSYTIGVAVASQIKYSLIAVENCSVDGNRIYVHSGQDACVMLELLTLADENVAFSAVDISSNGVNIKRDVNNINISSVSGGEIVIYSSSLLSYAYFYVCVC